MTFGFVLLPRNDNDLSTRTCVCNSLDQRIEIFWAACCKSRSMEVWTKGKERKQQPFHWLAHVSSWIISNIAMKCEMNMCPTCRQSGEPSTAQLKSHAAEVDSQMRSAEVESITHYIQESDNLVDLHAQIAEADQTLQGMTFWKLSFSPLQGRAGALSFYRRKNQHARTKLALLDTEPYSSFIFI